MTESQTPTPSTPLQTAVLFLVFNRPDTTARVFEAIRKARPPRLYVAADGPRAGREGEAEKVAKTREIATAVDWPCEVKTLLRKNNLGCKMAVSGAITWFFEQEEQGIILEDDCLPHPDFFTFCESLLHRYRDDERISVITGDNFQDGRRRGEAAYYFSKYPHCWGWASWRRAWQHYQGNLPFWPEWQSSKDWCQKTPDPVERRYWVGIFERVRTGEINSWAYPWGASVWYHGGLTATPNVNLVSNIGFGPDGTHTLSEEQQDGRPVTTLGTLTHPRRIEQNKSADRYVFDHFIGGLHQRWYWRLCRLPRRVAGKFFRIVKKNLGW